MTHTQTTQHNHQPSIQDITAPHPRCVEMAEIMRDIAAVAGSVTNEQLLNAGFATYEIEMFANDASEIANKRSQNHEDKPDYYLEEMIQKAREAIPNKPPLPNRVSFNNELETHWGKYCSARAAYTLYNWAPLRERAIAELLGYLLHLPVLPAVRTCIVRAVEIACRQRQGA